MTKNYISSVWDFSDYSSKNDEFTSHDFLRWYGKLIPPLVSKLIKLYTIKNDIVFANFLGSGTVAVESNFLSRNFVGIDSNPLSILLTKVKTSKTTFEASKVMLELQNNLPKKARIDWNNDEILKKWFKNETYNLIDRYLQACEKIKNEEIKCITKISIASIIKKSSNVDSRCVNHLVLDKNKKPVDFTELLSHKLSEISKIIRIQNKKLTNAKIKVHLGDSKKTEIKSNSIDFIISHPPYLGAIDYANMYQLENHLLGLDQISFKMNDISTTSYTKYLNSMQKVFGEMYRVLKPNKYAAVVIGDNRKNGKIQPTFANFINFFTIDLKMELHDIFIWVTKGKAGMNVKRHGNYIDHNYILIFKKI